MYSRAAGSINRRHCESCGAELTAHQGLSTGICDKPQCHEWMIEKVGQELIERKRRENAEALEKIFTKMAPAVTAAAAAIDATPDTIVRSKIPHQSNPLVPLSDKRRTNFETHLRTITANAFTEAAPAHDLAYRDAIVQDPPDVLDTACTACKGGCCALGGDTGFLQIADVDRWRQEQPGATEEDIVDYYLGMLPDEVTDDACVFQGAEGCTLPRAKRSDQCNTFYCKSLQTLQENLMESETGKVVFITSEKQEVYGVVAWSPDTARVPLTAQPKAETAPEPIVMSSGNWDE